MARPPVACPWLRELAAGYLPGYARATPQQRGGLWGFFFARRQGRRSLGLFVGFLTRPSRWLPRRLSPPFDPPECAVFAFVQPVAGRLHQRQVGRPGSLFRRSYELVIKYTARRPRFEFYEQHGAALIRHVPLAGFPVRQREKYARNFFMETLALLVRTRLPEDLLRVRLRGL